jgi:polyisoprenoid-binding protein YceI
MTSVATPATTPATQITPGVWEIDSAHSEVGFTARHMMVSKVRGRFGTFSGTITTAEDPAQSSVDAVIDVASVDTGNQQRDNHLRSADFLDAEKYPEISFRSTGVRPDGNYWVVDGELTVHGVTRPVPLLLELNGVRPDPYGNTRAGFSASTEINRRDFGVTINMPMDGGGAVVSDRITINLEVEAVLAPAA